MSQWITQSHTLTLSSNSLPEITGQLYGKEFTEPLLHVRRLYGHEAVGELYEYIIEAEVRNPDFLMTPADAAQVDLEKIIGKWATVTIQIPGIGTYHPDAPGNTGRANVGADKRYISGDIVEAKIRCMEDRAAVYEFVLRPSVWYATQNRNSFIFKDASVIDVLKKILNDYHSLPDWRISGPWGGRWNYPPRDMIRQAWESDWQFVNRLMEEAGLFYCRTYANPIRTDGLRNS